jgi:hypothetical protein
MIKGKNDEKTYCNIAKIINTKLLLSLKIIKIKITISDPNNEREAKIIYII